MTDSSLTAEPCFYNDVISHLSGLLDISWAFYANQGDSGREKFLYTLRTIVGLGFTACLTARYNLIAYRTYFERFSRHALGNIDSSTTLAQLSKSVATMVGLALPSFQALDYPDYYRSFIKAIVKGIDNPQVASSGDAARRLLNLLQSELRRISTTVVI